MQMQIVDMKRFRGSKPLFLIQNDTKFPLW